MKVRFFGDSWYWCWFPTDSIKSNALNRYNTQFPVLNWVLNAVGIDTTTQNIPGQCFRITTKTIVESTNDNDDITYNVVFVSAPYRNADIKLCDVTDYDKFMYDWNSTITKCLNEIQEWAHKNNQQVMFVGGHMELPRELFDTIEDSSNLHLLSECIISELLGLQNIGKFRFCDFGRYIDTTYDKKIIDEIYEDTKQLTNGGPSTIFWPDNCHLNPTAMLLLADKILYKIEQLEGERI